MKRIIQILVLAITFVTGITTVSAQTVQVLLTQKVPALPSTAISYLEGPFRYFNTQFIVTGAGPEGLDIFFDMEMTVNTSPLYVRTRPGSVPMQPIHLSEGVNIMRDDELNTQVLIRTETNYDYSDLLNVQQLPEGTYTMCLDFYRWIDKDNPNRVPITIGPCPTFEICYSGSAPELVSPMAGAQMNLKGNMVLKPSRKINFFWTPVISNCAGRNTRFKYKLKVVKVLIVANEGKSQPMPFYWGYVSDDDYLGSKFGGYDDPNVFPPEISIDVNNTYPNDPQNPKNKSSRRYGYNVDDETEEGDESEGVDGLTQWEGGVEEVSGLDDINDEMKVQYIAGFIQDEASVASLTKSYPDERKYVPTPKRRYVESDGYYTVPMTDDLEVSFMPTRHESLKNVSYTIELYENIEGADIDSITSYEPLFVEEIKELPDSYSKMDSHELVSRTLNGWGTELEQGNLYYLQLSSFYTVNFWKYSIADTLFYVNEMFAEHVHDTTSRDFIEEELTYSNGVMFRWGDDPESPDFKTPQWKTPVDRTSDDIYDPVNYGLPTSVTEVQKGKAFPVTWTPVKNVAKGDTVEYEVNVYELKPDQTLEEALSDNDVLVTRTVTDANEISENDKDFFKVFSPKKTYVMTLSTIVNSEDNTYHFENGNSALPIVFKVVK